MKHTINKFATLKSENFHATKPFGDSAANTDAIRQKVSEYIELFFQEIVLESAIKSNYVIFSRFCTECHHKSPIPIWLSSTFWCICGFHAL